jgi:hypothetical protein
MITASACTLLAIIGIGSGTSHTANTWDAEIRRRRAWATYLMHCHNAEATSSFAITGMDKVPLPWPEADFEAGYTRSAPVTLESRQSNGGIFAEVIKILSLW